MRKVEFVERVAGRTQVPETVVRAVLDGLRAELIGALGRGEAVAIDGLGRFRVARQVRSAPCSLTGATGGRMYMAFKAARLLKEDLAAARVSAESEVRRLKAALDRLGALSASPMTKTSRSTSASTAK